MDFKGIQKKATAKWENLVNSKDPVIYYGAASCGRAAGSLAFIFIVPGDIIVAYGNGTATARGNSEIIRGRGAICSHTLIRIYGYSMRILIATV